MRFPALKRGDSVLVRGEVSLIDSSRSRTVYLKETVVSVTKTQFTTGTGKRFMLDSGRMVGGTAYRDYAYPIGYKGPNPAEKIIETTPEEIFRLEQAVNTLRSFRSVVYWLNKNDRQLNNLVDDAEALQLVSGISSQLTDLFKIKKEV